MIEYRLSLSIHLYSNITASKNELYVENETQVPLEHVGPSNPELNNFKPADGEFQQRHYSHFMLRIYQRQENYLMRSTIPKLLNQLAMRMGPQSRIISNIFSVLLFPRSPQSLFKAGTMINPRSWVSIRKAMLISCTHLAMPISETPLAVTLLGAAPSALQ